MFSCVQLCGRAVFSCVHRLFGISRCVHSCASRSRWPRCVQRPMFTCDAMPQRIRWSPARLGVSHRFYLIGKPLNPHIPAKKGAPRSHAAQSRDDGPRTPQRPTARPDRGRGASAWLIFQSHPPPPRSDDRSHTHSQAGDSQQ